MESPQKSKSRVITQPGLPLLGIHPEKARIQKDMYPNFHSCTVHNSQHGNSLKPIERGMGEAAVHTCRGTLLGRKNETMSFAGTRKDLEGILRSEVSQKKTNTGGYHLYVGSKI